MKTYFIWQTAHPHETQKQFIDYPKKSAVWLYLQEFKHLTASELTISKNPYLNF